ncbi:TPA: DUF2345 domain-containing protein, partial [Kluyvera intermedia]|nr:DUF2345 domain-containing protein [Kluyvera intermedia]
IFISADGQERAQGQVREMAAALSELQRAQSLAEAVRSAAEVAKAELADVQARQALLAESLTELKQAALLLSAPEGIAQVTPRSLQLSAGENLVSTAGQHADFSVLKKFTVAAGEVVSLFARKLGIKIFAGRGKVEIQAQSDDMTLDALKDIRISSCEGKILICAEKEIILTSGGGYIRIADGTVECAAPDKIIERGAVWQKFGGRSMDPEKLKSELVELPKVESGEYNIQFLCVDDKGRPYNNNKYIIFFESGMEKEGVTDSKGYTEIFFTNKKERVDIHLIFD